MKSNHTIALLLSNIIALLLSNKFDDSRVETEVISKTNSAHISHLLWENKNIRSIAINQTLACVSR